MARWLALSRLPDRATKDEAQEIASVLHGDGLIAVISLADWTLSEEERQIRMRNKRLFGGESLPGEDPEC